MIVRSGERQYFSRGRGSVLAKTPPKLNQIFRIAYVVNAQIDPGEGSPRVSALIRRSQVAAVCHALR